MTLSEMRQLLDQRGIQLTKSLGQNFLHDGNQLRRIVEAAAVQPGDKVLEIGPGLGPLTAVLLGAGAEVLAIEKDARLVEVLSERFGVRQASRLPPASATSETGATPVLHLLHADALELLRREPRDWTAWKLVANLPYSVASPILVELALSLQPPERMVVTLQLEVARRLTAQPDTADYGLLTLLVQLGFEPKGTFKISPECFFPPPEVTSACVVLVRRAVPLLSPGQAGLFARVVKLGFSQRRKMMLKLLKQSWPAEALERAFIETGLSFQTRAEAVSLEQFVRLTGLLGTP